MSAGAEGPLPLVEPRLVAGAGTAPGDHGFRAGDRIGLAASRCPACGLPSFPRRGDCERCGEPTEAVALHEGTVVSVTRVIHPPPDALVPVPYGVGFVSFPEGLSVLGLLDGAHLDFFAPGVAVGVIAYEAFEGRLTYAFTPVAGRSPA